jgi:membrane-associated phospholipid phosphatase
MRPPEWVALAYFAAVAATAVFGPFTRNRARVLGRAALVTLLILIVAQGTTPVMDDVRDWMPGLYAVFGYWIPGLLVEHHHLAFERRLNALDAAILPAIDRLAAQAPRVLLEYLELAYLCCYPLVPCAFAWLAFNGHAEVADRYWTTVLLALYPCYGLVPWLTTRPPRAIESRIAVDARRLALRPVNLRVLGHVSIQINTFPSGHTAGALAAAAVVGTVMPLSGAAIAIIAVSIAIASVVGRYHYTADALTGALVAVGAFACAEWWLGPAR